MAAGASANAKPIACPRCGYDQRGAMATWRESCPLEHTCAECGLTFEWADVFDPLRSMPRWCVESDRGRLRWPAQFVRTTARAWLPPALWKPLRMSHRHDWPRQAGYVLAWLLALWMVMALCNGFLAFASANVNASVRSIARSGPWSYALLAAVNPWDDQLPYYIDRLLRYWPYLLGLLSVPLTTGLAFAALPISRRRAKVQWRHIRRAGVYLVGVVGTLIALLLISRALGTSDYVYLAMTSSATTIADVVYGAGAVLGLVTTVMCFLLPFIVFWYWHACIRHHLRMQHAWAVSLSVVIIGALASCAIGYWANEWLR